MPSRVIYSFISLQTHISCQKDIFTKYKTYFRIQCHRTTLSEFSQHVFALLSDFEWRLVHKLQSSEAWNSAFFCARFSVFLLFHCVCRFCFISASSLRYRYVHTDIGPVSVLQTKHRLYEKTMFWRNNISCYIQPKKRNRLASQRDNGKTLNSSRQNH